MTTNDALPDFRVVYVGGRKSARRIAFLDIGEENERTWRQRLATEMEEVCREMLRLGLHLTHVVPVIRSTGLTEGGPKDLGSTSATSRLIPFVIAEFHDMKMERALGPQVF